MTASHNGSDHAAHTRRMVHAFRITRAFAATIRRPLPPGWYANVTRGEECMLDHFGPFPTRTVAMQRALRQVAGRGRR